MIASSQIVSKAELEIFTFDNFDVKFMGESITPAFASSPTIFNLLKFFIAHKDKFLSVEYIEENLWDYKDYYDLKNAIKGQVFRLRKNIDKVSSTHCMGKLVNYIDIRSLDGCYALQLKGDYFLDYEKFSIKAEELLQAKKSVESNLEEYLDTLCLYKNNFMSNSAYEGWIASSRNHYKRLYLKLVRKTVEILREQKNDKLALDILEKALSVELFDEALNMCYMQILISHGRYSEVLSYFKYIRNKFSKEYDMDSSKAFHNLEQLIYSSIFSYNNYDSITRALEEQQRNLSVKKLVNTETYNRIEILEKKLSKQKEIASVIMDISLELDDSMEAKQLLDLLPLIVEETIRKSDVYNIDELNLGRIKVLLFDIHEDKYHIVKERLLSKIVSRTGKDYNEKIKVEFKKL